MLRWRYGAVALAAILWAVGGTFARTLIDRGASVTELTAARAWIAFLGVGALVLARKQPSEKVAVGIGTVASFGLALAAANYLYYFSIALLPVAIAIVVQYTAPGLVVAWKSIVERKGPSKRVFIALGCALVGVVLLSELQFVFSAGLRLELRGLLAAFGSAIAFASYIILGERMGRKYSPEKSVFLGFLAASLFWLIVIAIRGTAQTLTEVSFWPGILFLGVAATIFPFLLFLWGLHAVKASAAGVISMLEPVAAALLAFVWLSQALGFWQVIGGLLVVTGIAVVQTERPSPASVMVERTAVE